MKFKVGDLVTVLYGRHAGKVGEVKSLFGSYSYIVQLGFDEILAVENELIKVASWQDLDRIVDEILEEEEELLEKLATDEQVGGDHYKGRAIQPIDYILANELDFCEGNVVKYVTRWRFKNGIEDLKKARQYLDFMIEEEESKL